VDVICKKETPLTGAGRLNTRSGACHLRPTGLRSLVTATKDLATTHGRDGGTGPRCRSCRPRFRRSPDRRRSCRRPRPALRRRCPRRRTKTPIGASSTSTRLYQLREEVTARLRLRASNGNGSNRCSNGGETESARRRGHPDDRPSRSIEALLGDQGRAWAPARNIDWPRRRSRTPPSSTAQHDSRIRVRVHGNERTQVDTSIEAPSMSFRLPARCAPSRRMAITTAHHPVGPTRAFIGVSYTPSAPRPFDTRYQVLVLQKHNGFGSRTGCGQQPLRILSRRRRNRP